jgi:hypothetical protein
MVVVPPVTCTTAYTSITVNRYDNNADPGISGFQARSAGQPPVSLAYPGFMGIRASEAIAIIGAGFGIAGMVRGERGRVIGAGFALNLIYALTCGAFITLAAFIIGGMVGSDFH